MRALLCLLPAFARCATCGGTVRAPSGMALPLANVSACGTSVLTDGGGAFSIECDQSHGAPPWDAAVWARQYEPRASASVAAGGGAVVTLQPRPMPGFPATEWRFEGWAVDASRGAVPGSVPGSNSSNSSNPRGINFLAHPSAYRPPAGDRVFLTSTANSDAGPGWTQGYWQTDGEVAARCVAGQLVNISNPAVRSTAFTGRMVLTPPTAAAPVPRLLLLVGMDTVSLLENKNLQDPSRPEEWVAAEGDGALTVDFAGAPTAKHEDYRLHVFAAGFDCNGTSLRNWLFVIPDALGGAPASPPASPAPAPPVLMNHTNLRSGNLRRESVPSQAACAAACDGDSACRAWVFTTVHKECFLKNGGFCANNASDPCGGCAPSGGGACPCSAGIKPGAPAPQQCFGPPTPAPAPKPGRACGRMGFASASLTGPYRYCGLVEMPDPQGLDDPGGPASNCDSWPGDLLQAGDGSLYFVNGWGNLYKAPPGTLRFARLGNATIARPAPSGSRDDLHQIEFTFLPPREAGGRWLLYHASYASTTANAGSKKADYGYKQAIGMYSFVWDAPSS